MQKNTDLRQQWEVCKSTIASRQLKAGEPLNLVHHSANRPLDENTDAEAWRWLDLFVRNVESDDTIKEY